jgi:hypothetical protein
LDYGLPDREGLGAELAVEAADVVLVALERGTARPNTPVMHISASLEPVVAHTVDGRRRNVRNVGTLVLYNLRDQNLE